MQEVLKDFEHDWESHLLLREADAKGAAAVPVAAPADCLDAVPDAPTVREEDEQLLLPGTTWPFAGPRGSVLAHEVQRLARELAMDFYGRRFQPHCSDAMEYNPQWNHGIQDGSHLHLATLQRLFLGGRAIYNTEPTPCDDEWVDPSSLRSSRSSLPGARALHTGDSRPPKAGSVNLPPPVWPVRRELTTCAFHVAPRLQASLPLLHRGPSLSPTVYYRPAPHRAAARRSWASAPGARCWSGRRRGRGTGSARRSAWRACPLVPFPALAPGHPLTPPGLTPGRAQSVTTGVTTRGFAGLAPPRTARSVTAGVASLAATRCVRTTWTPSSGARVGADMAESQRS